MKAKTLHYGREVDLLKDLMARNVQTDLEDQTDKAQAAVQLRLF